MYVCVCVYLCSCVCTCVHVRVCMSVSACESRTLSLIIIMYFFPARSFWYRGKKENFPPIPMISSTRLCKWSRIMSTSAVAPTEGRAARGRPRRTHRPQLPGLSLEVTFPFCSNVCFTLDSWFPSLDQILVLGPGYMYKYLHVHVYIHSQMLTYTETHP